eukprot:4202234-Prymnesium_polylepis.1
MKNKYTPAATVGRLTDSRLRPRSTPGHACMVLRARCNVLTECRVAKAIACANIFRLVANFDQHYTHVYEDERQLSQHHQRGVLSPAHNHRTSVLVVHGGPSLLQEEQCMGIHRRSGLMVRRSERKKMLARSATRIRACSERSSMRTSQPAASRRSNYTWQAEGVRSNGSSDSEAACDTSRVVPTKTQRTNSRSTGNSSLCSNGYASPCEWHRRFSRATKRTAAARLPPSMETGPLSGRGVFVSRQLGSAAHLRATLEP